VGTPRERSDPGIVRGKCVPSFERSCGYSVPSRAQPSGGNPIADPLWGKDGAQKEGNLELLQRLQDRLGDPTRRFIDEVFWYWPLPWGSDGQPCPQEPADWAQRVQVWQELAPHNYAAQHNLAVWAHQEALQKALPSEDSPPEADSAGEGLWRTLWDYWKKTLENEGFWKQLQVRAQVHGLSALGHQELRETVSLALALTAARLEVRKAEGRQDPSSHPPHPWRKCFEEYFGGQIVQEAFTYALQGLRQTLDAFCQDAKRRTSADPLQGGRIAWELVHDALPKYTLLTRFPCGDSMTREAAHLLVKAIRVCLQEYEDKTEDWETCIQVLEVLKKSVPARSIPKDLEDFLQRMKEYLEEGDRWHAPGYWELPPQALETLEKAKKEIEGEHWEAATRLLKPLTISQEIPVQRAARFALAQCLQRQCVREINSLLSKIESLSDLIDKIQNALDGFPPFFQLVKLRSLVEDHNRQVRRLKERLPNFFNMLLEARRLNPLNKRIEKNLEQIRKVATQADVQLPSPHQEVYVVWEIPSSGADGKCWFCGQRESQPCSNLLIPLWKVGEESPVVCGKRCEYMFTEIAVPRCKKCQYLQKGTQLRIAIGSVCWALLGTIVMGTVALLYLLYYQPREDIRGAAEVFSRVLEVLELNPREAVLCFLGLIASFTIVRWIVSGILKRRAKKLLIQMGTKPVSAIDEYPLYHQKIAKGWKKKSRSWMEWKNPLRMVRVI